MKPSNKQMKAKNNISSHNNEELREFAPTLSKIEKQNPFQVPERYFDALPAIVQERCIKDKGASLSEWLQYILNPRILAPISVSIVLIAFGINFFISQPTPDPSQREERANALKSLLMEKDALLSLEQLSAEDIYTTMEAGDLYDIDEYLIVEALIRVESEDEGSDDAIIDYLIENGIELSTIINEL